MRNIFRKKKNQQTIEARKTTTHKNTPKQKQKQEEFSFILLDEKLSCTQALRSQTLNNQTILNTNTTHLQNRHKNTKAHSECDMTEFCIENRHKTNT